MNRKILTTIIFAVLLFAGLTLFNNVNAVTLEQLTKDNSETYFKKEVKDGETVYTLQKDVDLDIRVGLESKGDNDWTDADKLKTENVVIDLNGHKITNYTEKCEAIKVFEGSTLTIRDSSSGKTGTIKQKNSSEYSVITNEGTLNIESGNVIVTQDFYAIRNEGILNISGGQILSTSATTSTIGNVKKKDSNKEVKVTVSGTASVSSINGSAINNFKSDEYDGDCTIIVDGGTVQSTMGHAISSKGGIVEVKQGKVLGGDAEDGTIYLADGAKLTVSGGDIYSGKAAVYATGDKTSVNVTSGNFTAKSGIVAKEGANISVSDGANVEISQEDEGYGVFKTKSGKSVTGKYSDITFKVNGQDSKDIFALVIGETSSVTAVLNGEELTDEVTVSSENKDIVEVKENKIIAKKVGNAKVTFKLNDNTYNATVSVISSSGISASVLKKNLSELIEKATSEKNSSEELTNAIEYARRVLENAGATYGELQKALANLQSAYDNFKGEIANTNQGIVSGDKGKLDNEPKMGEGLTVFGVIAICAVLMLVIKSRKRSRK